MKLSPESRRLDCRGSQSDLVSVDVICSKLRQALLNLYRNAFQSIPYAGDVHSTIRKNGAGVVLEISNTQNQKLDPQVGNRRLNHFIQLEKKGLDSVCLSQNGLLRRTGGEIHLSEKQRFCRITFEVKIPSKR